MIVLWQDGYMVDWDWATQLTVWTSGPDRAEERVGTHRLDSVPGSERKAFAAARQWWQQTGQAEITRARQREAADASG
ncbi:MAG: hypothetical protein ACRDTP_04705 [Mycobacteriales bacterium]